SSQNGLRLSADGGATFNGPFNFIGDGADTFGGNADLAFASNGGLYWANVAGQGRRGITVNRTHPLTRAHQGARPVGNDTDSNMNPAIATGNNPNHVYAVWTNVGEPLGNAEVQFAHSTNAGQTWIDKQRISNNFFHGFTWPADVAVGPNGYVYVAFS